MESVGAARDDGQCYMKIFWFITNEQLNYY